GGELVPVLAVLTGGAEHAAQVVAVGQPGLEPDAGVLPRVVGAVEGEAPVLEVEGLDAVRDPVAELVEEHLAEGVVGIEVLAGAEPEHAAAVGAAEDRRVAADGKAETAGRGEPDDLEGVEVAGADRAFV